MTRARLLIVGALLSVASAAPAGSSTNSLAMLDQLERGTWELKYRAPGPATERICLADGRRLIQLRHPGPACERVVVADGPNAVKVQYTCHGRGYGRTELRRETNRLVQVQSQGIADGLPYELVAEARRIGDCPA